MLLCMLCAFVSFVTTSLCVVTAVTAYTVPHIFSNVCDFTIQLLEWTVYVATFLAELSIFLFGVLLDIVNYIVHTYNVTAPYVVRAIDMAPFIWRDSLNILNQVRVDCWNFVIHQTHAFLGLWALLLATVWTLTNRRQPHSATNHDGTFNAQRNVRENVNPNNRGDTFPRRRNAEPVIQRLYPDLSEIDVTYYDRNDDVTGLAENDNRSSGRLNHTDDDLRQCIVCLDRERGVAIFPCGHTHMCLACTRDVMRARRRCPVCQTDIEEYRTVFL